MTSDRADGAGGVGRSQHGFNGRGLHRRVAGDAMNLRDARGQWREGAVVLEWVSRGDQPPDLIKLQPLQRRFRDKKMT